MKICPAPLEIGDDEGFTPEKDIFNRRPLADGMSNIVSTVTDPLSIAFDGPWGSGKTTFLKMWAGELRKNGHPVIFFDAFENDYIDDAFAALAREIVELAERSVLPDQKTLASFLDSASRLGSMLIKSSAKVGLKVAVRTATAGLASSDDFKDIAKDIEKESESAANAYIDQILSNPNKQKETIKHFRDSLQIISEAVQPKSDGTIKPLIFIVDELDRCKPLFALGIPERIKRFMLVPNVHFVFGVNLSQIHSSIKYAYGIEIDANAYLQKFINITILCNDTDEGGRPTTLHKYAEYLRNNLQTQPNQSHSLESATEAIIRITRSEHMSFRTLERAFSNLSLAIAFTPPNALQLGPIMGGLIMMKLIRPELFLRAKHGALTLSDASSFLRFAPPSGGRDPMSWEEKLWTFSLAENLPENLREFGNEILFRYSINGRPDIVRYTSNHVVDRLHSGQ